MVFQDLVLYRVELAWIVFASLQILLVLCVTSGRAEDLELA